MRIESDVAKTTAKVMPFWMSFLQQPSGRSASDLVKKYYPDGLGNEKIPLPASAALM